MYKFRLSILSQKLSFPFMLKKAKEIFFLFCFLIALAGAGYSFPIEVEDLSGNRVLIESKPMRVITLGPSVTEVAFSLIPGDRIAGVTDSSNYPPEAAQKEKVGDIYINYEKIIALKPDLVLAESTLTPSAPSRLKKLGINVLSLKSDNYENFTQSLLITAKALGEEQRGVELLQDLEQKLNSINDKIERVPAHKRPKVFIEVWNNPIMTTGSGTFIHYVLERAGGVNMAGDLQGYPQLNLETLLIRNPDVIILTVSSPEVFLSSRRLRNIRAVREGRVYKVNPDILVRPTLRLYDSCRTLYNFFYPQQGVSYK